VANEVNTPLGISLTDYSILEQGYLDFNKKLKNDNLSMGDIKVFCETIENCFPLIKSNLNRATNLVENF